MATQPGHLEQHFRVLTGLARSEAYVRGDLEATLREVTEVASRTMTIQRVNVWLYDAERSRIRCIEHFDRSTGEHSASGVELAAADYPVYFEALAAERTIVADDARTDPRTSEFAVGYLDVNGITSMLDAPLRSGGEVIGILCHEHVGEPRRWTTDEQRLAGSIADFASLALETAERRQAEGALRKSEALTREIIARALDAIVIIDEHSVITDWNPRAETVFGWTRDEAIGRTLYETLIPERFHEQHRVGLERFLATGEGAILNGRIELHARRKEGDDFPVELSVTPLQPLQVGETRAFAAFVRDITDRVRAQAEVDELHARLEERVEERTEQLRAAVSAKERLLEELQASSLELVARLREVEQKSEIIRTDLERAQVIQRALLPASPPQLYGVHVDALYRPGKNVGGDLYDVTVLEGGRVAVYVADAAGHGVAAAMLSVLFKQRLCMVDDEGAPLGPAEVLQRVNRRLALGEATGGLFLTVGYAVFDPATGELRIASAGHTPIVLRRANGETETFDRTGPALGIVADARFTEHALELEPGDRLLLYSDGLIDGLSSHHAEDVVGLVAPALEGDVEDGPERLRALFRDVERRARASHEGGRDDVTLLALVAEPGPSTFDNEPDAEPLEPAQEDEPAAATSPVLWVADASDALHLTVRGRGLWTHADTFRRLAHDAHDRGKRVVVDLTDCTDLDSTFLGTLHEVVADDPAATSVGRPCESVRELFTELGLVGVADAIDERSPEPPSAPSPVQPEFAGRTSQERLLRAHEVLSELSEENRERFQGLVQALRVELGLASRDGDGDA